MTTLPDVTQELAMGDESPQTGSRVISLREFEGNKIYNYFDTSQK